MINTRHRLDPLFNFKSVALIGASDRSNYGLTPYRNLQIQNYPGKYFPVSRAEEVHGQKAYKDVLDIPEEIDAAIISVGRDQVIPILRNCITKGAKAAIVFANGFAEAGPEGKAMQDE